MKFTAREIFGIFLVLIVGLLALAAWQAFFTVMANPGLADIWRPTLWFSLLAMFFFLGAAVWTDAFLRIAGAALVFAPGFLFMQSWEYVAAGGAAAVFAFWSTMDIVQDFRERLRFRFFKSVRAGAFFFVVGLSLALSSGYYVFLQDASWEELVPRFRIGEEMTKIIFKAAGTLNPSFALLAEGDATVDEFLLSLEESRRAEPPTLPSAAGTQENVRDISGISLEAMRYLKEQGIDFPLAEYQESVAQELFLRSGREQIAELAGRPVRGDEKISDILSLALQYKLIAFLRGGDTTEHVPSQAVPFFLSLLLFFTLLSLLSLLGLLCILGAQLLFILSLRIGWLKLGKITVEQERLIE